MAQQIIGGNINADGSQYSGTAGAFSVTRVEEGIYEISFSTPFATCPVILSKQNNESWGDFTNRNDNANNNTLVIAVDESLCRIKTGDSSGKSEDKNFTFLALDANLSALPETIIAGSIGSDGTKRAKGRYSSFHIEKGYYMVVFEPQFRGIPVVVADQVLDSADNNTHRNAIIVAVDRKAVMIKTGDPDGDAADCNFNFLAYDPVEASMNMTGKSMPAIAADISSDGTIHSGFADMKPRKMGDGIFAITLNKALSSAPLLFCNENYADWLDFDEIDNNARDNADPIAGATPSQFQFKTGDANGNGEDRNFGFLAVAV